MGQIVDSLFLKPLRLVVEERAYGAAQGHRRAGASRRLKPGNESQQVGNQNKKSQGNQKWSEAFAVTSDDLLALAHDESMHTLEGVLQRSRFFHRKPRADDGKQDHQEKKNHELHGDGIA